MTTLQYCISDLAGRVLGFAESETMPCDDGRIAHVMLERVAGWPKSNSPTEELWISNGALHWLETATLDELKARKSAEITADRLASDAGFFSYGGLSIRTADKDIFDMLIAHARIMMGDGMPPNWPGGWKAIENEYVPIPTIAEWRPFFTAMYDAGIDNFNRSQQLKARISAASTPEQVAAIKWDQPKETA